MKKVFVFVSLLIVCSFFLSRDVSASGIISQPIEIKDAMRGQTIEELLSMVSSSESNIVFKLGAEGDIANWVSYKKYGDIEGLISEITAPPKNWAKARVFIKIPDDTPNGEYTGYLTALISAVPSKEKKENISVGIAQQFKRLVKIAVTDNEIVDFNGRVMPEKYFINKIEPLNIKLIYTNNGNISIRPQAQIKISNPDGKEIFNAIYPYPENEASVRPRSTKEITVVYFSGELKDGLYSVEVITTLNGEEKYRESFNFTVGAMIKRNKSVIELLGFVSYIGGGNTLSGGIIIITGLFLISIIAFPIFKVLIKKLKFKKNESIVDSKEI